MLMGDKWKERYSGRRIIQWDNTDIKMHKPGSADMQRSTYSSYYSSNCTKGAVRLQLYGWMGTKCLFLGAISVTEYMLKIGIFNEQNECVDNDISDNGVVPSCNELDKSYRCLEAAYRSGEAT